MIDRLRLDLRNFSLYFTIALGLFLFTDSFVSYAWNDYPHFIKSTAWNSSGDHSALLAAFAASGTRFTFRLAYVISFMVLFFRWRGAVYLCLIAWLGQLVPTLVYTLIEGLSFDPGQAFSLGTLVIYCVLIVLCWQLLKRGRALVICAVGLGIGLLLHTALFAFLWSSAVPVAATDDGVKQEAFWKAVNDGDGAKAAELTADGSFHPLLRGKNCNENSICNSISYAVMGNDNVQILEVLQKAGSRLDDPDGSTGDTPIIRAMLANHMKDAEYLAAAGADPMTTNRFGVPAFIVAAGNGTPLLLETLIKHGAAVNLRQKMPDIATSPEDKTSSKPVVMVGGITPMMIAGYYGRLDLIKVLLAHGANPEMSDEKQRRVYDYIAAGQAPEIAEQVRALINDQPAKN